MQPEYDILLENNPYDQEIIARLWSFFSILSAPSANTSGSPGTISPARLSKVSFKLNSTHIEYVLSSFKENASKVRTSNSTFWLPYTTAPLTISNYYDALVRHDMANGSSLSRSVTAASSFPGGFANWHKKRTRQPRQSGLPVRQSGEKSRKRNTRPGPLPRTKTPAARHRKFWNRRAQSRSPNGRLRNRSCCSLWTGSGHSKTIRSK